MNIGICSTGYLDNPTKQLFSFISDKMMTVSVILPSSHHFFISSVSHDKKVFYISDTISARNRVYFVIFNTEDHTQRGQKHLQLSVLGMLFIHSGSGKFKKMRTCAGSSMVFAEPMVTLPSSLSVTELKPASYQKLLILCKSDPMPEKPKRVLNTDGLLYILNIQVPSNH